MCYAKPGPRCTAHVGAEMMKAKQRLDEANAHGVDLIDNHRSDPDFQQQLDAAVKTCDRLKEEYVRKVKEYDSTPGGIELLNKKLGETPQGTPEYQKLKKRLRDGVVSRETKMEQYKLLNFGPKMTITVGPPASGKTTWAVAEAEKTGAAIVCRDDTREAIGVDIYNDGVGTAEQEKEVIRINEQAIIDNISSGKDVIVADMNAGAKVQRNMRRLAERLGVRFEVKEFRVPLEELKRRNAARDRHVPDFIIESVVERMNSEKYVEDMEELKQSRNYSKGDKPGVEENFFDPHSDKVSKLLNHSPVYRKNAKVSMRVAQPGEKLTTTLKNGKKETSQVLNGGERIVRNPSGEEYAVSAENFDSKYELVDGEYVSRGQIRAVRNPTGNNISIMAPWGELQHGDKDCFIAQSLTDPDDRYIIDGDEFKETYKLEK